ncbi:MAG: T9SS type A sorting domain-containing protein [Bacteroidales bacterium]|nr:T9SS type A sorting domain-containing protein [Bacteroidales bacterium]
MKKILLFAMALSATGLSYAQSSHEAVSTRAPKQIQMESPIASSTTVSSEIPVTENYTVGDRSISIIPIGASGNAYSIYGNGRTYVWADPNVNSVVFSHRMVNEPSGSYGNARVAYDVSANRGAAESWTNNVQIYEPLGPGSTYPEAAGRYPQGAIINPEGNTDPAAAYYTYFIACLDGTNDGSWGGFGYGVNGLTTVDPAAPTQHNVSSDADYKRLIPDALTVTQQGVSWMADGSSGSGEGEYTGKMIMNKGTLVDGDIVYEEWLMDVLAAGEGINDTKIAFSPDGQTGYLLVMSETLYDPQDYTNYHPVLYETTDGGDTWTTDPNHCVLGGVDGIEAVKNFITDEVLNERFPDGWDRDELYFNMGFHADMAVDANGNAHLTGFIGLASTEGWYPYYQESGTFHIWYDRATESWDGEFLYSNKTWEGTLGDISQHNRPQISSDIDGNYLFISWIDTDIEDEEQNVYPDIYLIGYDVNKDEYKDMQIVTQFTGAMYSAFFATQSHYVFKDYIGDEVVCTIPFVYGHMDDPQDPVAELQYKYIDGVTESFTHINVAPTPESTTTVKQNFPNPSLGNTTVEVELSKAANLSIEVTNLVGQVVYAESKGNVTAGAHEFTLNTENYTTGVYFYTVKTNNSLVTKKMIVK